MFQSEFLAEQKARFARFQRKRKFVEMINRITRRINGRVYFTLR